MKSISGSMGLMTLPDIMQWAEAGRKSGTLTIRRGGISKSFYVQDGKIIFVSSQKKGERLGEFFSEEGNIDRTRMEAALRESQRLNVPFSGYLISEEIIGQQALETLIERLAEKAFTDALPWADGTFEFTDSLPVLIVNGPVKISTSYVVFQSVKQYDETHRQKTVDTQSVIVQIARQISEGNIEIPPVPDIMQKLNSMLQRDDTPVQDFVELIMADQILTSKILRVVNSAFYSPPSRIISLKQAIIFMGLKSIVSIATVHALSSFSARNAEKVREVLRHSLLCAFIAKRMAGLVKADAEEAFACGLLHDIGKTVIMELASDLQIAEPDREALVRDYHEGVGYMVTSKWNFSAVLQVCAKNHHHPEKAAAHGRMVDLIFVADHIANTRDVMHCLPRSFAQIDADMLAAIRAEVDGIRDTVQAII